MADYEPTDEMKAAFSTVDSFSKYKDLADKIWATGGRTDKYKTGWPIFDEYIGGGFANDFEGELVVIVAETGVGKSTFATNLVMNATMIAGEKCHYMTLENSFESVYNMMRSISGNEDMSMTEKYFTSPSKDTIFGGKPWNANDLLAHMNYVRNAHGTRLFVLDHLNFMFENEDQVKNELARVRVVMRLLSQFCINTNSTCIVVSHTNKAQTNDAISLERIYGSSAIAGAATKVLALNEFFDDEGRYIDVQLLKSRHSAFDRKPFARFDVKDRQWQFVGMVYRDPKKNGKK